jgi:hypothetical protein
VRSISFGTIKVLGDISAGISNHKEVGSRASEQVVGRTLRPPKETHGSSIYCLLKSEFV